MYNINIVPNENISEGDHVAIEGWQGDLIVNEEGGEIDDLNNENTHH